jgi:hypothetical protein
MHFMREGVRPDRGLAAVCCLWRYPCASDSKVPVQSLRRRDHVEVLVQMLAQSRSGYLALQPADLSGVPGLLEALNALTVGLDDGVVAECRGQFDLRLYESHVQAHLRNDPVNLAAMPSLGQDLRKDLIWRFIAVIFLAHAGVVDIWQAGQKLMVMKHEANGERQDIFGESETTDGIEGFVG